MFAIHIIISSIFSSFTILSISLVVPRTGTPKTYFPNFPLSSSITATGSFLSSGFSNNSLIIIFPATPAPTISTLDEFDAF